MKSVVFLLIYTYIVKAWAKSIASPLPSLGWKSCDPNTETLDQSKFDDPAILARRKQGAGLSAECQTFQVPLCYPGICDSNSTITLFVKRIASSSASKAIWVMDGGPGAASIDMEFFMQDTFMDMNGTFSVYTMDHRGTGRSTKLECSGDISIVKDAASCVNSLNKAFGYNAAGFSTTSAAMDIVTLSPLLDANAHWFAYGVSYGTYLMERVMHLENIFAFKGYILESVVPETMDIPNGDAAYGAIVDRILNLINVHKKTTTPLHDQLVAFYKEIDSNTTHKCGSWVRDVAALDDKNPPSYAARRLFGVLLASVELRSAFYTLFRMVCRCSSDDLDTLRSSVEKYIYSNNLLNADIKSDYDSLVLYYVILSSEHQLFYTPVPTLETLLSYFAGQIAGNPVYRDFMQYCLYTHSEDSACKDQGYPTTTGFVYEPDTFFNKTANLSASLLVLNGALDPITPDDQARYQFDQYEAPNKLFVNLSDASHSVVDNDCGYKIFIAYLMNEGNTAKVDTTCLADRVADFSLSMQLSEDIFGSSKYSTSGSNDSQRIRLSSTPSIGISTLAFVYMFIWIVV